MQKFLKTSLPSLIFSRIKWRQHSLLVASCVTERICTCRTHRHQLLPTLTNFSAQLNELSLKASPLCHVLVVYITIQIKAKKKYLQKMLCMKKIMLKCLQISFDFCSMKNLNKYINFFMLHKDLSVLLKYSQFPGVSSNFCMPRASGQMYLVKEVAKEDLYKSC